MSSTAGRGDEKKILEGFHMQIPTQQPKPHKKRKRELANTLDLSSSSSSSSDEDEDTKKESTSIKAPLGDSKEREIQSKGDEGSESTTQDEPLKLLRKGPAHLQAQQPEGWRVKLYRLNADGSWDDCGTGRIACLYKQQAKEAHNASGDAWIYQELKEPTLCMQSEVNNATATTPRILLRTRILLRDAYQRQGENIITWCEPYLEDGNSAQGVDLALSFQDNSGCLDIWRQITQVQSKAADLFRRTGVGANVMNVDADSSDAGETSVTENPGNAPVAAVTHTIAEPHPTSVQQQEAWVNVASKIEKQSMGGDGGQQLQQHFEDSYNENSPPQQPLNLAQSPQLPNPPTLQKLEEIADTIASIQHVQQREALAMFISQNECQYLKSLISLFPSAEARGDYASLATLAACAKTILLLNDPALIELIVSDSQIFEDVCATLEYDPDLRDKANHRWFLRERAKFRTIVLMEDDELIEAIHRSFRVTYLRDTLLRPTMDESSLSTLSSLQTFTHADVVKGVTKSPVEAEDKSELLKDSYLAKIIRVLGRELLSISELEWEEVESLPSKSDVQAYLAQRAEEIVVDASTIGTTGRLQQSQKATTIWQQHVMPQDNSLGSRRARRRGSLSFLRELFNMVRNSLQQTDQDDFFAVLVSMEVDLSYGEKAERVWQEDTKGKVVNLLSLLGTILSDPNIDVTEKGSALEIVAGIAVHDTSLIRSRCLDSYEAAKTETTQSMRPRPNENKQIVFRCPPNDLLASLLFLLATETDAGVLLQVSEIMRIILDTDMMGDHGPMGAGFSDKSEEIPPSGQTASHDHPNHQSGSTTEQNKFLSMFYEHYIQWLAAPFQYSVYHPVLRMRKKDLLDQPPRIMMKALQDFEKGNYNENQVLRTAPLSALRSSFAVELLSFCVRAHVYRMKCYLLRSGVLGSVLRLLKPANSFGPLSGDRCLKLAALRFLREILSVNDEFYHRHIIQHNLFGPVFEAFRANPVGDNLVSSATVEMCDFIHSENINSLIEHIVTKHLSVEGTANPSLEDLSSTYVNTLTVLRTVYEKNLKEGQMDKSIEGKGEADLNPNSRYTNGNERPVLNEKASEDQRKFREIDNEEAYFDGDDEELSSGDYRSNRQSVAENHENTSAMFSFVQSSMVRGGTSTTSLAGDQQKVQEKMEEKCAGS